MLKKRSLRIAVIIATVLAALLVSANAAAAVTPLTFTKSFSPTTIPLGGKTTVTFSLTNPDAADQTGINFTDTLPPGLAVSTTPNVVDSCGNAATAPSAGDTSVALAGVKLTPNAGCSMSVDLTPTTAGAKVNATTVKSDQDTIGVEAQATVTVIAPPAIAKAFSPTHIAPSATTTLTFTITNPSPNTTPLTGVGFNDTLPTGLTIVSAQTTPCGGNLQTTAPETIALTGASVDAGSPCTFGVTVTGGAEGQYTNTTSNVTSNEGGNGNAATADLTVAKAATIAKAFAPPKIPLNGITRLTFTIGNPNTAVNFTGLAFSDTLTGGLQVAASPSAASTCGTFNPVANSTSISLTGGTLTASDATCTVAVDVIGTTAGATTNVSGAVSSNEGGTGNTANDTVTVVAPPNTTKAFGAPTIPLNGTTSLTFTLTNPTANTIPLTGVGFTDTLPPGMIVASPNGLSNLTGACAADTTASPGSNAIALTNTTIPLNASCSFRVNVMGTTSGIKNNTTGPVGSNDGGFGPAGIASVTVLAPGLVTKAFGAATVPMNEQTTLSISIANPNSFAPITAIAFTDALPAGLVVASPTGLTSSCGGAPTATPGAAAVSLSGGAVASSGTCTFKVNVTGTTAGVKNNSVTITSSGGTSTPATASVTVVAPPTLAKSFGAASVPFGGTTTLTFTVVNPNAATTLTGIGFGDTLPTGLVVSDPNGLVSSCGGTIVAPAVTTGISLADASLAAGTSCTLTVNVTGTTTGTYTNTTSAITSANGGDGAAATATLTVDVDPEIIERQGYWMVASDGGTFPFGAAGSFGSLGGVPLNQPIVAMAATPDDLGYWLVASDGGVFTFGRATYYGSLGGMRLNRPIVAIGAMPDGLGYWLIASDGGVFSFGSASYYGSTGSIRLNRPVIGIAVTLSGHGYWLVASDGGIFPFGDAVGYGSLGSVTLNKPIVGMAATRSGLGYWLVAADGGIFSFGDATWLGSLGGLRLNAPITAITTTPTGLGYWLFATDGGVFTFGDATWMGSLGGIRLNQPIIGADA